MDVQLEAVTGLFFKCAIFVTNMSNYTILMRNIEIRLFYLKILEYALKAIFRFYRRSFSSPGTNISGRMGTESRRSSLHQSELPQIFTTDRKCHKFLSDHWHVDDFVTAQVCDQADGMDRRFDN